MRRKSRELALQILFQTEFAPQIKCQDLLHFFEDKGLYDGDTMNYANHLIQGVEQFQSQIDSVIQGASAHWRIERMNFIDRNIMRIAVFEMKFDQPNLTSNIAINEAVELAKLYGTTDSASFVNGVLDQVQRLDH